MSCHPITMFELASARRTDLLREAANQSLGQRAMLSRGGSHALPLPGIVETITAALRHRQRVTATRIQRHWWTSPA